MSVRVSHLTNIPSFRVVDCRAQFSAKPGDKSTGLEGNLVDGVGVVVGGEGWSGTPSNFIY